MLYTSFVILTGINTIFMFWSCSHIASTSPRVTLAHPCKVSTCVIGTEKSKVMRVPITSKSKVMRVPITSDPICQFGEVTKGFWVEVIVFLFFLIFLLLGDGYGRWLREAFVFLSFSQFLLLGDGCGRWLREVFGRWLREMATGSLCFPLFLDIAPFRGMVTGDGYGRWLRGVFVFLFFLIFLLAGDGYGMYGYGKSLGDGYGRWSREVFVFLCFLIFLLLGNGYGRWLREVFVFLFFLICLLLGDGYGRWLREVFVFLSFSQFLLLGDGCGRWLREVFGRWLREMATGSLFVFLFCLDISPFRGMVTGDGYGRWLRGVFIFLFFLIFLLLVKIHLHWFVGPASIHSSVKPLKLGRCNATNVSSM